METGIPASPPRPGWDVGPDRRIDDAVSAARGLGYFSLGLGLYELLAPGHLARLLGMEEHEALIRAYGLREIATGVGILRSREPAEWVWGRVGGDALDLTTLAAAGLRDDNRRRGNVLAAMAAVAGVAVADVLCARRLTARKARIHDA
jgi:hypothetical protein